MRRLSGQWVSQGLWRHLRLSLVPPREPAWELSTLSPATSKTRQSKANEDEACESKSKVGQVKASQRRCDWHVSTEEKGNKARGMVTYERLCASVKIREGSCGRVRKSAEERGRVRKSAERDSAKMSSTGARRGGEEARRRKGGASDDMGHGAGDAAGTQGGGQYGTGRYTFHAPGSEWRSTEGATGLVPSPLLSTAVCKGLSSSMNYNRDNLVPK